MREFRYALRLIVPIVFEYVFVGLAFAMLMQEAGYSFPWTVLSAVFVYAGSMQLVMVSLLAAGAPLLTVAVLTFFINGRHIFYGLGFIDRFKRAGLRYPYMALTLTDEAYSVLCAAGHPAELDAEKTDFFVLMNLHLLWIFSCALGAVVGKALPVDLSGIEFSATAFFTTVCVDQWRKTPSHLPALMGLAAAVLFYLTMGPDAFILPALSVTLLALLLLRGRLEPVMGGERLGS